jgi:uncharacterized protein YjiS (DUF1127 family)
MFITNLIRAFAQWQRYRAGVRELSSLDDRGLDDIGLNRSMIRDAARVGRDPRSASHAFYA